MIKRKREILGWDFFSFTKKIECSKFLLIDCKGLVCLNIIMF